MTDEELLPCRESFEEWFSTHIRPFSLEMDAGGICYKHIRAQVSWKAWQAAWNTRAQPQNVDKALFQFEFMGVKICDVTEQNKEAVEIIRTALENLLSPPPKPEPTGDVEKLKKDIVEEYGLLAYEIDGASIAVNHLYKIGCIKSFTNQQPDVNMELLEALKTATEALETLPEDIFGFSENHDNEKPVVWPIRNEMIDNMKKAIAKSEQKGKV